MEYMWNGQVHGDRQLVLRGEHLPLGFLAVEEEKDQPVEDMSSLDAVTCL